MITGRSAFRRWSAFGLRSRVIERKAASETHLIKSNAARTKGPRASMGYEETWRSEYMRVSSSVHLMLEITISQGVSNFLKFSLSNHR